MCYVIPCVPLKLSPLCAFLSVPSPVCLIPLCVFLVLFFICFSLSFPPPCCVTLSSLSLCLPSLVLPPPVPCMSPLMPLLPCSSPPSRVCFSLCFSHFATVSSLSLLCLPIFHPFSPSVLYVFLPLFSPLRVTVFPLSLCLPTLLFPFFSPLLCYSLCVSPRFSTFVSPYRPSPYVSLPLPPLLVPFPYHHTHRGPAGYPQTRPAPSSPSLQLCPVLLPSPHLVTRCHRAPGLC